MKNVLISGCTGLLGSNLVSTLLEQKDVDQRIIGIGRRSLSERIFPFIKDIDYVVCDINNYKDLDHVINHYKPDEIYHLAAEAIVKSANESPLRALETNIMGTANVLESARQNHVKGVVCMASDKYYGQNPHIPYHEHQPPDSKGVYEVSKMCSDRICYMYGKNYNVPVLSIRGANLFGPGDFNFTRLVPNSVIRLLRGEKPILWKDVTEYVREFVYVKDAAQMLTKLMYELVYYGEEDDMCGEPVNVGSGYVRKVKDFVDEIIRVTTAYRRANAKLGGVLSVDKYIAQDIEIREKDHYFKEIPKQALDLSKLRNLINEIPYTPINKSLYDTVDFYVRLRKLFKGKTDSIGYW